jgi:hypothetical protein
MRKFVPAAVATLALGMGVASAQEVINTAAVQAQPRAVRTPFSSGFAAIWRRLMLSRFISCAIRHRSREGVSGLLLGFTA